MQGTISINKVNNLDSKTTIKIPVVRSKHGIPCIWEEGGSNTNTGKARIVGDRNGRPKKPIYVKTYGHLACLQHALIPIRKGDTVLDIERYHDDIKIKNYVIKEMADEYAVLQMSDYICWEMLQAAVDKVYEYHCRVPVYIKTDSPAQQEEDEDFEDEDFEDEDYGDEDFDEDASFEE